MKIVTENSVYQLGYERAMTEGGSDEFLITLTKIEELRPSHFASLYQVFHGRHLILVPGARCNLYATQIPKFGSLVISTSFVKELRD